MFGGIIQNHVADVTNDPLCTSAGDRFYLLSTGVNLFLFFWRHIFVVRGEIHGDVVISVEVDINGIVERKNHAFIATERDIRSVLCDIGIISIKVCDNFVLYSQVLNKCACATGIWVVEVVEMETELQYGLW